MSTEKELELLSNGWKRETLALHITEWSGNEQMKARRLSYDLGDSFTQDQIYQIKSFVNEVNNRFPNIKICITGTGFIPEEKEDNDIQYRINPNPNE